MAWPPLKGQFHRLLFINISKVSIYIFMLENFTSNSWSQAQRMNSYSVIVLFEWVDPSFSSIQSGA